MPSAIRFHFFLPPVLLPVILLLLFSCCAFNANAQNCSSSLFAYGYSFDGAGSANFLEINPSGQFILGGLRNNKNTVIKTDQLGNLIWSKQYDFEGNGFSSNYGDAKIDKNGDYFIQVNAEAVGLLDTAGNIMTLKKLTFSNGMADIMFLGVLPDNKKLVYLNDQFGTYILLCLSPDLTGVVWSKTISAPVPVITSMSVLDNRIFFTGVLGDEGILFCVDGSNGNILSKNSYQADNKMTVTEAIHPYSNGYIVQARYNYGEIHNYLVLRLNSNFEVLNIYRLATVWEDGGLALAAESDGNFFGAWGSYRFAINYNDSVLWNRLTGANAITTPRRLYSTDKGLVALNGANWYNVGQSYAGTFRLTMSDANGIFSNCPYYDYPFFLSPMSYKTAIPAISTGNNTSTITLTNVAPLVSDLDYITGTSCTAVNTCDSLWISGVQTVCSNVKEVVYVAHRNEGCYLPVQWKLSGGNASLQKTTDSSIIVNFSQSGTYQLVAYLSTACSNVTDTLQVKVSSSDQILDIGPRDSTICPGGSLVLNAHSGFTSYQWQDGSADSVFTVTQPGVYFVSVDNVCGEVYKDSINVLQVNVPALNIGSDTSICKGDTLHLAATPGFNQYAWQPANSVIGQGANVNIYALQNISVTAIANTIEGCKAYDTLSLSLNTARPVSLGNDTNFCTGDSLILSAGAGYLQYNWSNGAVSPSVTAKQAGMYSVTATDVNGCRAKDTMLVQLYTLPVLSLGNDFNLCNGDQQQLDAGNFNEYLWQDGTTDRYYNTSTTGSYWVTVADVHSCTASDTIQVKDILPLPADFLNSTDSICQYEKITIGAIGSFSSYLWSTGAVQPVITVDAPGLYTLTVKDTDGCAGTDSLFIVQKDCFAGVFIPTAFTPNGDTKNDVFRATVYGSLVAYRLEIFNRFGEMVFSTTDLQKGWDGIFKGVALSTGSFVWQCSYQFAGKSTRFIKGNVVLVR